MPSTFRLPHALLAPALVLFALFSGCASTRDLLHAGDLAGACRVARGDMWYAKRDHDALDLVSRLSASTIKSQVRALSPAEVHALLGEPLPPGEDDALLVEVTWRSTRADVTLLSGERGIYDPIFQTAQRLPPLTPPQRPHAPLGPRVDPRAPRLDRRPGDGVGGLIRMLIHIPLGIALGVDAAFHLFVEAPARIARSLLKGRAVAPPPRPPHRARKAPWFHDALLDEPAWRKVVDAREKAYTAALAAFEARKKRRAAHLAAWRKGDRVTCDHATSKQGECRAIALVTYAQPRAAAWFTIALGQGDDTCERSGVTVKSAPFPIPLAGLDDELDPPRLTHPPAFRAVHTGPPGTGDAADVPGSAEEAPARRAAFRRLPRKVALPMRGQRLLCDVALRPGYRRQLGPHPHLVMRLTWGHETSHGITLDSKSSSPRITLRSPPLDLNHGDLVKLTLGARQKGSTLYLGAALATATGKALRFRARNFTGACRVAPETTTPTAPGRATPRAGTTR